MIEFLNSAVAFLVAIAILVAVHEWGHYIVARLSGVKVLRFSIGFGRPLWLRRWGADQTEYCLSAIPVGGYVKLLDERETEVPDGERHRAFNRQSIPARIAILLAGPGMNLLFAIIAYWAMFVAGVPGMKPVVGDIEPGSIAERAGLRAGDQIVQVGGQPVSTWESAVLAMLDELLDGGDIPVQVRHADGRLYEASLPTSGHLSDLTEPGQLFEGLGLHPWAPVVAPVIEHVVEGGSAERSGLKPGDRILAADGRKFDDWGSWVEFVRARPGQTVPVTVLRDGSKVMLDLQIDSVESESGTIGRIGASVHVPEDLLEGMRADQRYGIGKAAVEAVHKTWSMSVLTVRMVTRMVTGDVSAKNISGPINIAQYAGYSASGGISAFLGFLAIVSISLGILNLLPVPMLDGGQIVYQLVEAVKGSPLSERAQMFGQQVGILFLLLLMSLAVYNDLSRLLD